ncbi:MAG: hydroxymethylbilane synthase [Pyrinomonadaceae bacterium]
MKNKLVLGSRGSKLALWQTHYIADLLKGKFPSLETEIKIIETTGDANLETALSKIGDKGLFTKEIEDRLLSGEIDLAIHSLKDLPTHLPAKLKIGAVSQREVPNDAFISNNYSSIDELPQGAKVATGSLRRKSQLLSYRPDLQIFEIRGNVPTRIRKFEESDLDAMVLAFAGLRRLELDSYVKQIIPPEIMLPAIGQGAVAVEIREEDFETGKLLTAVNHTETEKCILAERSFLRRLEGGCQVPIGGFAAMKDGEVFLRGYVGNLNGSSALRDSITGKSSDPELLGLELAQRMIANGANILLAETRIEVQKTTEEVI